MWKSADRSGVPLRTIVTAVLVVAFFYLSGKLIYRLRDIVLLMLVAGFIALILNPVVLVFQRYVVRRRGAYALRASSPGKCGPGTDPRGQRGP